jgi:ABC-type Fe3+-hydroxamate transport system substrate-binding protein
MESIDDAVSQLLKELSEAKMWSEEYQEKLEAGADISHEIDKADKKIEELESRAKKILKKLGCVSPKTRSVYNGMAGMLINWQEFKDNLE